MSSNTIAYKTREGTSRFPLLPIEIRII